MAKFAMKELVRKAWLESQFHIESVATSTEEIGNPVIQWEQMVDLRLE